jgi:hypothetical protein
MDLKDSLLNLHNLAKEARFRHGLSYIPVSSLAEQFYCEMKVDLKYRVGEVLTEAKVEGDKLHDEILKMERRTLDELIKKISSRSDFIASFWIGARVEDLVLIGKPDAVVFRSGEPIFLLELKTTLGDPKKL